MTKDKPNFYQIFIYLMKLILKTLAKWMYVNLQIFPLSVVINFYVSSIRLQNSNVILK